MKCICRDNKFYCFSIGLVDVIIVVTDKQTITFECNETIEEIYIKPKLMIVKKGDKVVLLVYV